jgi:hypothetical protein
MTPPLPWLPLIVGLGTAAVLIRPRVPVFLRILPFSLLLGLSYLLNFYDAGTVYHGIRSDQSFHLAFVQTVAAGRPFLDYYFSDLVLWYPPLYFWLTGLIAWITGIHPPAVVRLVSGLFLTFLPFLIYRVAREMDISHWDSLLSVAAAVGLACQVPGIPEGSRGLLDYCLMKPYEVYAGLLGIIWLLRTTRGTSTPSDGGTGRQTIVTGLIGGLIILAYAPWYPLFLLSAFICLLLRGSLKSAIGSLLSGTGLSLLVSSPYWATFMISWIRSDGLIETATGYFPAFAANPFLYVIGIGRYGLPLLLGIATLWRWRKKPAVGALGPLIAVCYLWIISTLFTRALFGMSFLPGKAMLPLLLTFTILSGPGLTVLFEKFLPRRLGAAAGHATLLIFIIIGPHPLLWNRKADPALETAQSHIPRHVEGWVNNLQPQPSSVLLAMEEGATYLAALTGTRLFIAPNLAYANPLAPQPERLKILRGLTAETNPAKLAQSLKRLGIDTLFFWKRGRNRLLLDCKGRYVSSLGKYEFAEFYFSRAMFENRYFSRIHEDEHAVAFTPGAQ